jgi:ADP-ribosylglycohydrolase
VLRLSPCRSILLVAVRGRLQLGKRLRTAVGYDLTRTADEIRSGYSFDVSCQGSVPESIICFLDSDSFEGSVCLAISLGGTLTQWHVSQEPSLILLSSM